MNMLRNRDWKPNRCIQEIHAYSLVYHSASSSRRICFARSGVISSSGAAACVEWIRGSFTLRGGHSESASPRRRSSDTRSLSFRSLFAALTLISRMRSSGISSVVFIQQFTRELVFWFPGTSIRRHCGACPERSSAQTRRACRRRRGGGCRRRRGGGSGPRACGRGRG